MKKKCFYQLAIKTVIVLLTCLVCFSCKDDDDEVTTSGDYVLMTTVVGADLTTYSTYGQSFDLTNVSSEYDNSSAAEMEAQYSIVAFNYNGSLYCNKYQQYQMEKWDVDESGELSMTADMDFTDLGYQSNLCFYTDEIAFTGGLNIFKLAIFNPTNMTRTGFIDLTAYSKLDSVTGFPADTSVVGMQSVSEMIIRDNYMYVAVYYCENGVGDWTPALNGCYIIVVDLDKVDPSSTDNSDAIVKEISDTRGSFTGAWASGLGSTFMILDENNDIYVLCHNMWAAYESISGLPSCALRIADGETDFDDDYYFDMEAASGGSYHCVMGFEYAEDGILFASSMDPNQVDPDNAWSYYTDPLYQWYKFDLYHKTATLVDETYTKGAEVSKTYFEDGYAYLPVVTSDECYILKTDIETLNTEKLFTTNGDPVIYKIK